jgi:hypothetical protein
MPTHGTSLGIRSGADFTVWQLGHKMGHQSFDLRESEDRTSDNDDEKSGMSKDDCNCKCS